MPGAHSRWRDIQSWLSVRSPIWPSPVGGGSWSLRASQHEWPPSTIRPAVQGCPSIGPIGIKPRPGSGLSAPWWNQLWLLAAALIGLHALDADRDERLHHPCLRPLSCKYIQTAKDVCELPPTTSYLLSSHTACHHAVFPSTPPHLPNQSQGRLLSATSPGSCYLSNPAREIKPTNLPG